MVLLTEETFTYVINGADRDYNLSTPGTNHNDDTVYKNIFLSEDFGIHMGSYLDSSVREYYCEVIQYNYNCYNDGKDKTETLTNMNFTQLYSDLNVNGKVPKNLNVNKARFPLTQMNSTKNNTHNDDTYNGITRYTVNQKQHNTFICENFNQTVKYFRMASLRHGSDYGFLEISSDASSESYGTAALVYPYSHNLTSDGATGSDFAKAYWFKCYPIVMMYMTPVYPDRIPRLLKNDNSLTLQISSTERISGENGFGADCTLRIKPLNTHYKKFKAVFKSLDVMGELGISAYTRPLCNFTFNFVCYDWDQSNYGYGGDKNSTATILTSFPVTFNYQVANRTARLSSYNGAIIEIENNLKDVRFAFLCSQMHKPTTDDIGGLNSRGFLSSDGSWEWVLTMKLYGIE